MNLLITGALGHIGSRFIHDLESGAYEEVILLDDLSSQRYCSLFHLPSGVRFRFVEDDICTADLESLFSGVHTVLHLAAITDAARSFELAPRVEQVNYEGAERVARACGRTGARLVFTSTTSVYGVAEGTVDEDSPEDCLNPQSPYATSKLKAERLIQSLVEAGDLQAVVCRFGTIFGASPGMRFHTAVNKFVWQAANGIPLTVWKGAMSQKRPYLELGDAVRALDFVVRSGNADNGLFNVLTTNTTVSHIVHIIRERLPDTRVEYVESPIMNQLSYEVSRGKFRDLGFEFNGDLTRGIGEIVEWLQGLTGKTSPPTAVD